ncbi:MAG: Gldg family protein [Kiritimatiellia bacterium]|jgi:hypothetical protein
MPTNGTPDAPPRTAEIRRRRRGAGVNVVVAVALAAAVFVVANYCASLLYAKWHFDYGVAGGLSRRTLAVLQSSQGEITMTALFEQSHPYGRAARKLLQEYAEAAELVHGLVIRTRAINVNHDVMEAAEVMRRHPAEANSILIEHGPEFRVIREPDMIARTAPDPARPDEPRRQMFIGESACTAAIIDMLRPSDSMVYFVGGHGEYDPESHHHITGASAIAQELGRSGCAIRKLNLVQTPSIPQDCDALVVAGPRTLFSPAEVEAVSSYLDNGGKALVLLDDPYAGGLAAVLERWGLRVANPPGPTHLPVRISTSHVAEHPATRRLANVMVAFSNPCIIETLDSGPVAGRRDKPIVSPLVFIPPNESALGVFAANTPQPAIAAAAELGASARGRESSKLLVCGDSDFISNAMTQRGFQGNTLFVLSAVEWLLGSRIGTLSESAANVALDPGVSPVGGWRTLAWRTAVALPLAILVFGCLVMAPIFRRL